MFVRQAVGFLLFLATSVLPGYAQQFVNSASNFSIDGAIHDLEDRHTVKNIRVELKQSDGTPVNAAFTRNNGEFKFSGLPSGNYILEVRVTDYEPLSQPVVIKNSSRRGQLLFLIKHATAQKWTTGAAISAHQLSAPSGAQDEFDDGVSLLYDKSDYLGAIAHFQRAIKKFPDYYEAYAQEGFAYQNLGEMPAAEESLRKSADLSAGKYSEALILLSELLCDTNRYEEAATFSRRAFAIDPTSWRGPFELARALFALQQFDDAEINATHARDLNPDNPVIYSLLANIHISRRNYSSLAQDLDAFLVLVPTGPDAEQARKKKEELQSFLKRKEEQSRASAQGNSDQDSEVIADADDNGSDDEADSDSEPDEADSVKLPPQPPATPNVRQPDLSRFVAR
jgi:tetratricopeptide (TPR) repeat protein